MAYIRLAILSVVACTLALAHPGFNVPSALTNLTADQKSQIEAIFKDTTKTKAQVKTAIQDWVNGQSQEIKDAYAQITSKIDEFKSKAGEWQDKQNLSADGKTLATSVQTVMQNDALTFQQTCEQINTLVQAASSTVLAEFGGKLKVRDCANDVSSAVDRFLSGKAGQQPQAAN